MSTSVEFLQASIWGSMSDEGWENDGEVGAVTRARTLQTKGKHGLQYATAIRSPLYSEREKESIGNNLNPVLNKRIRVPIGCWVRFYKAQERHSEKDFLSLLMKYQYKVWRQKCSQVIWNGKLNFWIKDGAGVSHFQARAAGQSLICSEESPALNLIFQTFKLWKSSFGETRLKKNWNLKNSCILFEM